MTTKVKQKLVVEPDEILINDWDSIKVHGGFVSLKPAFYECVLVISPLALGKLFKMIEEKGIITVNWKQMSFPFKNVGKN
jgi:hypothetical protein